MILTFPLLWREGNSILCIPWPLVLNQTVNKRRKIQTSVALFYNNNGDSYNNINQQDTSTTSENIQRNQNENDGSTGNNDPTTSTIIKFT